MFVALLYVSFQDNKQAKPTKMNENHKKKKQIQTSKQKHGWADFMKTESYPFGRHC